MATNDFVHDLVHKLQEDNLEYVVITLQKGKEDHKANAYFNIATVDGANMLLATANEVFSDEGVDALITDDIFYNPEIEKDGYLDGYEPKDDDDNPEKDEQSE